MGLLDPPPAPLTRVVRGREGIGWLGDSLTANGSNPSQFVGNVNTTVAEGATSLIVNAPYTVAAGYAQFSAPEAKVALILNPGGVNEEYVVASVVSGTGPYTLTVPALAHEHVAGEGVRSDARQWEAKSVPMWTHLLSGGRLRFLGVYAHGGYTAAQIQSIYLPMVLAAKPSVCVVCMGTNPEPVMSDIGNYIVPTVKALLAKGIIPIVQSLPPKDTLKSGNGYIIQRWNALLVHEARRIGVPVYDVYAQLVDPGSGIAGGAAYLTTYNSDDTHPSEIGARIWAQGLVSLINGIGLVRPDDESLPSTNTMNGDGTGVIQGSALTNVMMLASASGIPTGWSKSSGNAGDKYTTGEVAGFAGKAFTIERELKGTTDPIFSGPTWTGIPGHRYKVLAKVQTSGVDAAYQALIKTSGEGGGNTSTEFSGWDLRITNGAVNTDALFSLKQWRRDIAAPTVLVGEYVHPKGLSSDLVGPHVELRGGATTPAYSVTLGQVIAYDMTAAGAAAIVP